MVQPGTRGRLPRRSLDAAGRAVDPALVVEGDLDYASGFAGGMRLRKLDPRTAVFAASDEMALGVYEAVRTRGVRVPPDVSIVGFDDLPRARWSSPPLTTVRQPLEEMGTLAVRTVLRLLNGERPRERQGRAGHRGRRPRQHHRPRLTPALTPALRTGA